MEQPIELALEQQFQLRSFSDEVRKMSREQAQEYLVKLFRDMMLREAEYQEKLKESWGIK